ncbi:MAG TPA: acyl-CoA reductase [Candidatus Polarisedimenticolia bacterium]|nr:acyl-CoA reductase [Candidatus Polarisedimenticolia bacterium]
MNLPNYFLADLPPDAALTAAMVTDACQALKRNREQYLLARSTQSRIEILCAVAENWLEPEYPFRKLALENGPAATGFSRETLANGLDGFFKQFTLGNFNALLVQELGHARRLDEIVSNTAEEKRSQGAMARGPELIAHITAGNIPNPTLMSIALGVLTRSAQFVKCASGASFLPRLFAHSLYEAEPKLGACLEIAEWRGGSSDIERALFEEADCVTATGSDEALAAIRHHVPSRVRFLGYGHRLSFAYIASEALTDFQAKKTAARAAIDVVAWNQLGCLSPHVIYVEHGGGVAAEQFAEMLADELGKREQTEPRGEVSTETAATIASRRAFYEVRAAHSPDTRFWRSENSTAWTVVYEADARFQLSCLNRFIYVKGVSDLKTALENASPVSGKVSTVGIAANEEKSRELAGQLAAWGVTRICPLGQMQNPPLTWRHDGRPALGDLITWVDWEG